MIAIVALALLGSAFAAPQFNQIVQQPLTRTIATASNIPLQRTQQPVFQQQTLPQPIVQQLPLQRTQQPVFQQQVLPQQIVQPAIQQQGLPLQRTQQPVLQQQALPLQRTQQPVFQQEALPQQIVQQPQQLTQQPQQVRSPITVIQRTELSDENGNFESSVSQSDGTNFSETGSLEPTNDNLDKVVVKKGSYSYTSPEGLPVKVDYTADRYGFHPHGSVIPL